MRGSFQLFFVNGGISILSNYVDSCSFGTYQSVLSEQRGNNLVEYEKLFFQTCQNFLLELW